MACKCSMRTPGVPPAVPIRFSAPYARHLARWRGHYGKRCRTRAGPLPRLRNGCRAVRCPAPRICRGALCPSQLPRDRIGGSARCRCGHLFKATGRSLSKSATVRHSTDKRSIPIYSGFRCALGRCRRHARSRPCLDRAMSCSDRRIPCPILWVPAHGLQNSPARLPQTAAYHPCT